jgi:very-short-patch-repair endonuclease
MSKYLYNDPTTRLNRRRLRKKGTDAEQKLWNILRNRRMAGLKFFRQYSVGPYILDFYCPERRLAIADVLGQQYDAHRDSYLRELNIRMIRFWNNDVLQNIECIGERIKEEAKKHS